MLLLKWKQIKHYSEIQISFTTTLSISFALMNQYQEKAHLLDLAYHLTISNMSYGKYSASILNLPNLMQK